MSFISTQHGTSLQSCFTVNSGQNYIITVANYNGETFVGWSDGDGIVYSWGRVRYVAVPDGSTSTAYPWMLLPCLATHAVPWKITR